MFAATTASPPTTQRTGQLDADGWPGGRPSASRARTRTKIRRPSFVAVPPFPSVTVRSAVYRPGTVYRCSAESPEEPDPSPKFQVYVNASPSGSVACAVKLTSATGVGLGGRSCSTTVWAAAVASPIVGARFGCRPCAEWEPHHAHFVREEGTRSSKVSITPPRFGRTNAGVTERLM